MLVFGGSVATLLKDEPLAALRDGFHVLGCSWDALLQPHVWFDYLLSLNDSESYGYCHRSFYVEP